MIRGGAAAPQGFSPGWYGKMPAAGDFIARRLPASFSEPWDRWLQAAMTGSRERLGEAWSDAFLSMPPWRFVLAPGIVSRNAWAGLMVPSVDAVGRYFPLTVASALPEERLDAVATVLAATPWFEDIEAIALSALARGADPAKIDAGILQRPFRSTWLQPPADSDATVPAGAPVPGERWAAPGLGATRAAWLAEASELFERCLTLSGALPDAELYCAMMDGRWAAHGWARH
ncbi:MAG: type VI secretion system-associated protein TagF [Betaproteobacteria bacterium]